MTVWQTRLKDLIAKILRSYIGSKNSFPFEKEHCFSVDNLNSNTCFFVVDKFLLLTKLLITKHGYLCSV